MFLDRDGVINEDRDDYVKSLGELKIYPFAPESIRRLNEAGWPVFVISNQQGVAKGVIAEDSLLKIESEIARRVEEAGGRISGFYHCTHLDSDNCLCRKPKPGMLLTAAREHGIDLVGSIMVGDSERDIVAGKVAGCRAILLLSGHTNRRAVKDMAAYPDFVANDLAEATAHITRTWKNTP